MRIFIFLIICIIPFNNLQAQTTFQKIISVPGGPLATIKTNDGGYVMAGNGGSASTSSDIYLLKTNASDNVQWCKQYGDSLYDEFFDLQPTNDGGFIIAAGIKYPGVRSTDAALIKTDSAGNEEWTKTYGDNSYDAAFSVIQTPDSGYIFSGSNSSIGVGANKFYVVKTDMSGDTLWTRSFLTGDISRSKIEMTSDGGYLLYGTCYETTWQFIFMKLSSNGDVLSNYGYGVVGMYNYFTKMDKTPDGGHIIVGSKFFISNSTFGYTLTKVDSLGSVEWAMQSPDTTGAHRVYMYDVKTLSDGYLMLGVSAMSGNGTDRMLAVKTDLAGNFTWGKIYGTRRSFGFSIYADNNEINLLGLENTTSSSTSGKLFWVSIDSTGNSGCNDSSIVTTLTPLILPAVTNTIYEYPGGIVGSLTCTRIPPVCTDSIICLTVGINKNIEEPISVSIAPNPFSNCITISESGFAKNDILIAITNTVGQIIYKNKVKPNQKIELRNLMNGIYFVEIEAGNKRFNSKIVKSN